MFANRVDKLLSITFVNKVRWVVTEEQVQPHRRAGRKSKNLEEVEGGSGSGEKLFFASRVQEK